MVVLTFASTLAFAPLACAGDGEKGACAWLFAPPGFVDAGELGCEPEPAGQICNPSSGRCQSVCTAGEYLLTCRVTMESPLAIPEEVLQDPVVSSGPSAPCQPVQVPMEGSETETVYCCRCEAKP